MSGCSPENGPSFGRFVGAVCGWTAMPVPVRWDVAVEWEQNGGLVRSRQVGRSMIIPFVPFVIYDTC